jgi:excinuclease ABC subunit C
LEKINKDNLPFIISVLPESTGVYLYSDRNGIVIYIGKAKNIKKRVSSYFNKKHVDLKTNVLVNKIRNIEYLLTESEEDALLLENSLIKKHQPQYNILLKDDKTYPWIVVKNEHFPRIQFTRKKDNDNSHYYGPYTSAENVRRLLRFICSIYPIRTCKYVLSQKNIKQKKFRPCLQYHIKKCLAPCIGLQSEDEYNKNISSSEEILRGKCKKISQLLYKEMLDLASEMRFEEAEIVKKQYTLLKNHSSKSIVFSSCYKNDIDVFSYDENKESAYINWLHIIEGAIINGCTIEYKKQLNESKETILAMGIIELRLRFKSNVKEIIVPFYPDIKMNNLIFTVPQRGEKKKILCLSEKNVRQYKINQLNKIEKLGIEHSMVTLKTLQNKLHLKKIPLYIECFDNSNIHGYYSVSSCVVFKKAVPSKKDYRVFNIRTVNGINDFRSMYEVVLRRYSRLVEECKSLPDLIIVDGGKGQLNAAIVALKKLGIYMQISIIGIAKRLEAIYYPNNPYPIYLDRNSEELKLIQKLRDEAHRFGINFHRKQRSRNQLISVLDNIDGIGALLKKRLLCKYKNIEQIKNVPKEEIISLIGEVKTKKLLSYLL